MSPVPNDRPDLKSGCCAREFKSVLFPEPGFPIAIIAAGLETSGKLESPSVRKEKIITENQDT